MIGNSVSIDEIFYDCCSLSFFNFYNAIIHDDINLNNLFSGINKKCILITNDIKIKNFFNKKSIFSSKQGLGFGVGLVDEAADSTSIYVPPCSKAMLILEAISPLVLYYQ